MNWAFWRKTPDRLKEKINEIKNLRKEQISLLKDEQKVKIDHAKDEKERAKLKREYKNLFKYGKVKPIPGVAIKVNHLNKYYVTNGIYELILNDISLTVKEGEITVILGSSGGGKTTLLNVISGLISPDSGNVIVKDKDLFFLNNNGKTKFRSDYVSFIFQSYNLISSLTVLENIMVGENLNKKKERKLNVNDIMKVLGIDTLKHKYPYQLSGGQQQRVAIARALVKNPYILFADEPTGALDEKRGREILQLIWEIHKKYKTTIVMVTHDAQISKIANHVVKIGSGKILETISNQTPVEPSKLGQL